MPASVIHKERLERLEHLKAYVVGVIREMLRNGMSAADLRSPEKIVAAVLAQAKAEMISEWKTVIAEVGGDLVQSAFEAAMPAVTRALRGDATQAFASWFAGVNKEAQPKRKK